MDSAGRWRSLLSKVYREFARLLETELASFTIPLEAWLQQLLAQTLPANWHGQLAAYLDSRDHEFEVATADRRLLENWIESWARSRGRMPTDPALDAARSAAVEPPDRSAARFRVSLPASGVESPPADGPESARLPQLEKDLRYYPRFG